MAFVSALETAKERILDLSREVGSGVEDRLPAIRHLSEKIGVSRDTVWRALHSLREDGSVETLTNGRYRFSEHCLKKGSRRPLHFSVFAEGDSYVMKPLMERYYCQLAMNAPGGGYTTQLFLTHAPLGNMDLDKASKTDVAIVLGDAGIPSGFPEVELTRTIAVQTHPGQAYPNTLTCDYFRGGELAAELMLKSRYKRPMLITWAYDGVLWSSFELRILGFKKRWIEAGKSLGDIQIVQLNAANMLSRVDQIVAEIDQHSDCDYYFCFNDQVAGLVADILAYKGKRIPEDVGLVGFDGASEALNHQPRITTICQSMEALADITPELARSLVDEPGSSVGVVKSEPRVIYGETLMREHQRVDSQP